MNIEEIYNIINQASLPEEYRQQTRQMVALTLIGAVLDIPPHKVLLERHSMLSRRSAKRIKRYLKALKRGLPLGYILGTTEFCGLTFRTPRGVFLPRVETEELTANLIHHLPPLIAQAEREQRLCSLLDIGTGTGVIAITLKKHFPALEVTAIECSYRAFRTAQLNARRLLPPNQKIHLYRRDLLAELSPVPTEYRHLSQHTPQQIPPPPNTLTSPNAPTPPKTPAKTLLNTSRNTPEYPPHDIQPGQKLSLARRRLVKFLDPKQYLRRVLTQYDMVVSNPPYIGEQDPDLARAVKKHEPAHALFSGPDGLHFFRVLANRLPQILRKNGLFYFECGHHQAEALRHLFQSYRKLRVHKDMFGKNRFISGMY